MEEMILILDFGSQYTQLIARRVRELNVYCEIHPFNKIPKITGNIKGVIMSGSPSSVRDEGAPVPDLAGIRGDVPLIGVCYGAQYLAQTDGGEVEPSRIREYGRANLSHIDEEDTLMKNVSPGSQVWMSHGDTIKHLPANYDIITSTRDVKVAATNIHYKILQQLHAFHRVVYLRVELNPILSLPCPLQLPVFSWELCIRIRRYPFTFAFLLFFV
jgi:GMP synthase (glutamine-hydrolysing)